VNWPDVLAALTARHDLSAEQTAWAMGQILAGDATTAQIAGFAVGLRTKGETAAEVGGLVSAMLGAAAQPPGRLPARAVDTCGTGGDRAHTVNISTMAAFVVRGAGLTVIKHGNRAASSQCGSADLLEALGVVVDLTPDQVSTCLSAGGAAFCFAPMWHPALRHAASARRDLGIATVFNVLGPLTNPMRPAAQAVGVGDARLAPVMARVLADRGIDALVFRGEDGLDELTTGGISQVWVVAGGGVRHDTVAPEQVGLDRSPASALRGGDVADNAAVARSVLAGHRGPVRDAVLLNAAAAIVAHSGPTNEPLHVQLSAALPVAATAIDDGAAAAALEQWADASRAAAGASPVG
jgi:anthranilate phosphoribosyltransferase